VHQDDSAVEGGAGEGHLRVPEMTADVVDDLGSGFDGKAGGGGVEGVDREEGFGTLLQDGGNHGKDTGLLLFGGERCGVGASGFAADVEDVGAFVEHLDGLSEGPFGSVLGGVKVTAVGEGVGGDVKDAHDEGSPAESEGAGAEAPGVLAAGGKGHGGILSVAATSYLPIQMRTCRPGSASLWAS